MAGETTPEAAAAVGEVERAAIRAALLEGNLGVLYLGVLEQAIVAQTTSRPSRLNLPWVFARLSA